jgi:hypothetical protein
MPLLKTTTRLLAGASVLLLVAGCGVFRQTKYRQSCDLNPVMMLPLPDYIDTLAGCPRDETIVKNGINQNFGGRQPDNIKELFYLTRGGTRYEFDLYFTESSAVHYYEAEKNYPYTRKHYPVFREITKPDRSGCVHYTELQLGEWGDPRGYYSRAMFRLRNACILVTTSQQKRDDQLSSVVRELADMLSAGLVITNQASR